MALAAREAARGTDVPPLWHPVVDHRGRPEKLIVAELVDEEPREVRARERLREPHRQEGGRHDAPGGRRVGEARRPRDHERQTGVAQAVGVRLRVGQHRRHEQPHGPLHDAAADGRRLVAGPVDTIAEKAHHPDGSARETVDEHARQGREQVRRGALDVSGRADHGLSPPKGAEDRVSGAEIAGDRMEFWITAMQLRGVAGERHDLVPVGEGGIDDMTAGAPGTAEDDDVHSLLRRR